MENMLIVEDKKSLADLIKDYFANIYKVDVVYSLSEAYALLENKKYDIILSDLRIGRASGLDLLEKIKVNEENIVFIIMTAYGSIKEAVKAIQMGAFDFIEKPIEFDYLDIIIKKGLETRRKNLLISAISQDINEDISLDNIIGVSDKIKEIKEKIKKISCLDIPVLIYGETGTGKELIAKTIHTLSNKRGPFVPINCAAIPKELIESELFGAEAGSYTGITKTRIGKFEYANDGTLFLDEIGDMEYNLQAKLLRVIEEQKFQRIGSNKIINVNVRIISASNKNLQKLIDENIFRKDLFYRLNGFPLEIPPLRERKEDIRLLANYFALKYSQKIGKKFLKIDDEAIKLLMNYDWPGNIRELKNIIERTVILSNNEIITKENFDFLNINSNKSRNIEKKDEDSEFSLENIKNKGLQEFIKVNNINLEKEIIMKILEKNKWNKKLTAEDLKISYRYLLQKIKEYGIEE